MREVLENIGIAIACGVSVSLIVRQIGSYVTAIRSEKIRALLILFHGNMFEVDCFSEVASKSQLWVLRRTALRHSRRREHFKVGRYIIPITRHTVSSNRYWTLDEVK